MSNVTRRQAREWAIQMLTSADLNPPTDVEAMMAEYFMQMKTISEEEGGVELGYKPHGALKAMAEERVRGVLEHQAEIDEILTKLLQNWDLYRLGTVERAVLRMGIWELTYSTVPAGVVVNEAVDLVNWFSNPRSRQLVNGILDTYAKSRAPKA